jgi:hypothetical protein
MALFAVYVCPSQWAARLFRPILYRRSVFDSARCAEARIFKSSSSDDGQGNFCRLSRNLRVSTGSVAVAVPTDTGSVMDFVAGLVIGFVIGFMLAWFLFSWLTAMSKCKSEP